MVAICTIITPPHTHTHCRNKTRKQANFIIENKLYSQNWKFISLISKLRLWEFCASYVTTLTLQTVTAGSAKRLHAHHSSPKTHLQHLVPSSDTRLQQSRHGFSRTVNIYTYVQSARYGLKLCSTAYKNSPRHSDNFLCF